MCIPGKVSYDAQLGVLVHSFVFLTNRGPIKINCVTDVHGECILFQKYLNAQCAIIMFDVTRHGTYKNVHNWYRYITQVCGHMPIDLVGNKVDIKFRKVKAKHITFHRRKPNMHYYDMTYKSNYNLHEPFLCLARQLCG